MFREMIERGDGRPYHIYGWLSEWFVVFLLFLLPLLSVVLRLESVQTRKGKGVKVNS